MQTLKDPIYTSDFWNFLLGAQVGPLLGPYIISKENNSRDRGIVLPMINQNGHLRMALNNLPLYSSCILFSSFFWMKQGDA
jgi:hypothetical protein